MAYRRTCANIQVSGFKDSDNYSETMAKGAKGIGIEADPESLLLIVSNGLVKNAPLAGNTAWTLGGYIAEIGGMANRSKKTFGICIPEHDDEDWEMTSKVIHFAPDVLIYN